MIRGDGEANRSPMIRSMTGYGETQRTEDGVNYALEIRTVNHRYCKASIKLPDSVQFAEPMLDKLLRSRITRGSVTLNLRVRNKSETAAYDVNHQALASYAYALSKARLPDGVHATIDLATLSTLPGVCQMPEMDETSRLACAKSVCTMTEEVLEAVVGMREREGQALYDDLMEHCKKVGGQLSVIEERTPVVLREYHERLESRVEALLANGRFELDKDVIAREVALYADRCDISEEIVRLRAHVDHFVEICDSGEAVGRKLDFLSQEMLREANTIGSKSNDAAIARSVVELKSLIDRIKEQAQNAE